MVEETPTGYFVFYMNQPYVRDRQDPAAETYDDWFGSFHEVAAHLADWDIDWSGGDPPSGFGTQKGHD